MANALTVCGLKLERILGGLSHNDIKYTEEFNVKTNLKIIKNLS